eukprot:1177337-Amphidinium_carterae.1
MQEKHYKTLSAQRSTIPERHIEVEVSLQELPLPCRPKDCSRLKSHVMPCLCQSRPLLTHPVT